MPEFFRPKRTGPTRVRRHQVVGLRPDAPSGAQCGKSAVAETTSQTRPRPITMSPAQLVVRARGRGLAPGGGRCGGRRCAAARCGRGATLGAARVVGCGGPAACRCARRGARVRLGRAPGRGRVGVGAAEVVSSTPSVTDQGRSFAAVSGPGDAGVLVLVAACTASRYATPVSAREYRLTGTRPARAAPERRPPTGCERSAGFTAASEDGQNPALNA